MNDRNEFIKLIEQAYGVTSENDYDFNFREKGYTQKEVSEELGYDATSFGEMLKPDRPKKYRAVIAALKLKIQLNSAEEGLKTTTSEGVKDLKKELDKKNKLKRLNWFLYGMVSTGILLSFIYGFFLQESQSKENLTKNIQSNEYIDDKVHSTILDPSFEVKENSHYAHNWKNKYLGGAFQSTLVNVYEGKAAAKLPAKGDRIGYQQINVLKDKEYILSFYYTLRNLPEGSLTVSVLKGKVTDSADIEKSTIKSITLRNQSDEKKYKKASLTFNSGDNSIVSIYFTNEGVQCKLDAFNLEML